MTVPMTKSKQTGGRLGTFAGVFTPSILTILGIILFRRAGFVVGQAGLGKMLLIIGMAYGVAVLTSISLAAIASNIRVKGGGDYYLISRTLGVEFGGAIGIVLFLAQSVSIAFYCIGFGEAIVEIIPWAFQGLPRLIAMAAMAFLFIFAWQGADWATKLQYAVMTVMSLALLSFFIGGAMEWESRLIFENWTAQEGSMPFWVIFAIFFPAVTGFTQGVSMSGDLKDPGRSLPRGTFMAVAFSFLIYVAVAFIFAATLPGSDLMRDYSAMGRIAWVAWLISAGVVAATLSSAMASFLGAPRILQAIAADRIIPVLLPLAKGAGPTNNPRRAVLLSGIIALITVALGNLNTLAPVVAMFFLISYGLLNYATYYEARAASPSFRPRFRFYNKWLSLAGALGCLAVMLAINPTMSAVSIAVLFGIYQYLKRRGGPSRWAHGLRSYNFQRIRELLFEMNAEPPHIRDWRPQILAFSKDRYHREQMLRFSSWIEGGSGLTTVVEIIEATGRKANRQKSLRYDALNREIQEKNLQAFPLVMTANDFRTGMAVVVQTHGIGPLKANTVLLNWLEQRRDGDAGKAERFYGGTLREAIHLGSNIIVLDAGREEWDLLETVAAHDRRIDIWWGDGATSRLMLLLGYLMTRTAAWDGAKIRVLAQGKKKRPEQTQTNLQSLLQEVRIQAETVVVEVLDADVLVECSQDASLVFVPMLIHDNQPTDWLGEPLEELLLKLPAVALVLAAEDIQLQADPEDGEAGESAAAADAVVDSEAQSSKAEKTAAKAVKIVTELTDAFNKAEQDELQEKEPERYETLKAELAAATEEMERTSRLSDQARLDADTAAQNAVDYPIVSDPR